MQTRKKGLLIVLLYQGLEQWIDDLGPSLLSSPVANGTSGFSHNWVKHLWRDCWMWAWQLTYALTPSWVGSSRPGHPFWCWFHHSTFHSNVFRTLCISSSSNCTSSVHLKWHALPFAHSIQTAANERPLVNYIHTKQVGHLPSCSTTSLPLPIASGVVQIHDTAFFPCPKPSLAAVCCFFECSHPLGLIGSAGSSMLISIPSGVVRSPFVNLRRLFSQSPIVLPWLRLKVSWSQRPSRV